MNVHLAYCVSDELRATGLGKLKVYHTASLHLCYDEQGTQVDVDSLNPSLLHYLSSHARPSIP